MTEVPRIDYYFDVVSPYSWIGFEALHQLENQWKGVCIRYIPFSIGRVMKASGNYSIEAVHNRTVMMDLDLGRMGEYWDIPMGSPPLFTQWVKKYRTTGAMRVLLVLAEQDEQLMLRAAREMWMRLWSRCKKIFEDEDILKVLKAIGVADGEAVIEKSKEQKYGKQLTENSEKCVGMKAFGAPWIHVQTSDGQNHIFFGSDRFHLIAELLNQPYPLPGRVFSAKSKI